MERVSPMVIKMGHVEVLQAEEEEAPEERKMVEMADQVESKAAVHQKVMMITIEKGSSILGSTWLMVKGSQARKRNGRM